MVAEGCDVWSLARNLIPAGLEQLPIVRGRRSKGGWILCFLPSWRNMGVTGCDNGLNRTLVRERQLLVQKLNGISMKPTNLRAAAYLIRDAGQRIDIGFSRGPNTFVIIFRAA